MSKATTEILRLTETDSQWNAQMRALATAAQKSRKGILIDYVFEADHIVPQRLYRYDIFDDYLSRHRDDFEFGYDLITAARIIDERRTFGVYVIELNGNSNYVYVGQTWYTPEERMQQHLTGYAVFHAAKPFKRRGTTGRLRPDLYAHLPRFKTQAEAEVLESRWAMELRKAGYRVEGGH
jgi:hypothetical protein